MGLFVVRQEGRAGAGAGDRGRGHGKAVSWWPAAIIVGGRGRGAPAVTWGPADDRLSCCTRRASCATIIAGCAIAGGALIANLQHT